MNDEWIVSREIGTVTHHRWTGRGRRACDEYIEVGRDVGEMWGLDTLLDQRPVLIGAFPTSY